MSNDDLIQRTRTYAAGHELRLGEVLGSGIHGIVTVAQSDVKPGKFAIKVFCDDEPYIRERDVYERLREMEVSEILGFHVPQLVGFDNERRVVEMTVVRRPFVLDFAGAYLDEFPDFPDDVWEMWEADKREKFEERWPKVQAVLGALEGFEIYMLDVSPNNISF
jgi:hypothetical protein